MPTMLEMAEIPSPLQVQGESLVSLFFEPDKFHSYAYAETYYPRLHYGWSELKSIQNDRYKLIIAPEMELYDLKEDPDEKTNLASSSRNALAAIYLNKEDFAQAEKHVNRVLELNPKLREAHYHLAQILEERNELNKAVEAYKKELEYSPTHFKASFNLSRLYRIFGQEEEERKYLQKTIESNPDFPLSYFYLARISLNRGENIEEAIELVKHGIELKPERKNLPLGYFLLADLYNRLGNQSLSLEYAQKGKQLAQEDSK